ncbi:MAG TPA: cell division ATP-binding protein FtsE [Nitrospirae bacterium]|nr:cell division ATP-binding protein FtsE [bacterium BMS3Abin09]GBE41853.1 cell division ATP-binding protein FtsE [bacterium BMS3Bbin09]HDN94914.1 cell division ATP-binding protein FtsE [Nitrospirota bacterium]HDO25740.1 cell division ATP-binding protein FtsE [Nitrospirota bacterium]
MIRFSDVTKSYNDDVVIKDISLLIEKGELAYITGPSGAGKTTLLKLIYAAEKPDKGQIVVAGWDIGKLKQSTIPYLRRNVGIVFQDFRLLNNKTVFDNIALALRIHDMHPKEIKKDVNAVLKEVHLSHKSQIYPQHLSGGEQQRVVIARAMVSKPTVLLADEPTGNLDDKTSDSIMDLFREINAIGTTVLLATHDTSLFQGTGRRVIHIKNKQIAGEEIG